MLHNSGLTLTDGTTIDDLIDRINPFGEAYAILSKTMGEERLKQVAEVIAAKRFAALIFPAKVAEVFFSRRKGGRRIEEHLFNGGRVGGGGF